MTSLSLDSQYCGCSLNKGFKTTRRRSRCAPLFCVRPREEVGDVDKILLWRMEHCHTGTYLVENING